MVSDTPVGPAVDRAEAKMGGAGRVVLRLSGTVPLVRVMVEGEQAELVHTITRELAGVVESARCPVWT